MLRLAIPAVVTLLLVGSMAAAPAPNPAFMRLGANALAPMAFVQFCLRKPTRCAPSDHVEVLAYDVHAIELQRVHAVVNTFIAPRPDPAGQPETPWDDEATAGDCSEYALAKRSRLLDVKVPSSALLLAVAQLATDEEHLVVVVATDRGEFVLDNLQPEIVRWDELHYRWIKRSTPENPLHWRAIR